MNRGQGRSMTHLINGSERVNLFMKFTRSLTHFRFYKKSEADVIYNLVDFGSKNDYD